ncbi:hypothetical protein [Shimia ponticola]|uniref:hypothetical protein n=1 Tax=Shimia ponticola TaxID=2582893 RepID=UPI0011BF38BF|nr:hypothetical protein [Shimia ponticola]
MTSTYALPGRIVAPAFAGYVVLAVVGHGLVGVDHIWPFAALMMVLMTVTYPTEALLKREYLPLELGLALFLSAVAVIGAVTSPLLIIAAIAAHGVLDIVKSRGLGVPFFRSYLIGCAVFDFGYAAILLAVFLRNGGLA